MVDFPIQEKPWNIFISSSQYIKEGYSRKAIFYKSLETLLADVFLFFVVVVVVVVAVERISCLGWDWGTGPLLSGSPTSWSPPAWTVFVGNWRGGLCREVGIRRGGTHSWHSGPVGSCTRSKEDSSHFGAASGLFWCFVVVSARQGWLLEVSCAKPCSVPIRWWCCSLRLYESTWCHFCTILRCSSVVARLSLGGSWLGLASWVFEVGPCGSIVFRS